MIDGVNTLVKEDVELQKKHGLKNQRMGHENFTLVLVICVEDEDLKKQNSLFLYPSAKKGIYILPETGD